MALTGEHTYVGFGFGPIQAGLFLCEAFQSGRFGRLAVVEVLPELVAELRAAGGLYSVNIAHADHVETVRVGPVEVFDPAVDGDRERLAGAVAEAHEIATAIPSATLYKTPGPASLHRILADGLAQARRPAVVYAAENHNRAAEILEAVVHEEHDVRAVQFLNTVIGKMSGLAEDPAEHGLATVTPQSDRAFLVEAFNRILVSKVRLPGFERGIGAFEEKADLLPFEEAKLFGHNATHALAAYLARLMGIERIADLRDVPGFLPFLREAFLEESGAALIRKWRGVDELFTPQGYREYADDLLERMTNPFLMDTVERVGRDPRRKLGWDDRLIGTMRLALAQRVEPRRYAIGAAAAFAALDDGFLDGAAAVGELADPTWQPDAAERETVLGWIEAGRRFICAWRDARFPDLQEFFSGRWIRKGVS